MTTRPHEKDINRVINYLWDLTLDDDKWTRKPVRERNPVSVWVPVDEVLIDPFSEQRLQDCIEKARTGKAFPPIDCQKIVVGPHTFYTVNDGQHRTLAARQLGRKKIRAIVRSSITIDTSVFIVWNDSVWRKIPKQQGLTTLVVWRKGLSNDQWAALLWLIDKGKDLSATFVQVKARLPLEGSLECFAICLRCNKPLFGDVAYNAYPEGGHERCLVDGNHFEVEIQLTGVKPWIS